MEELNRKTIDRAVLVGLNADCFTKEETATETTLDELEALLNTAGGECAGKVLQNKHTPDPRSFIGEGKAEEVRQLVLETGANMVIFDNDLSPSQQRVLTELLGVQVLDRCGLILDIFAQRAKTKEGRLQVELAQYQYLLPRLTGMWTHLERQAGTSGKGPIGSKGPGETQLETDRRHIRRKIDKLREDLEEVRRVRSTQRQRRQKNEIPVVAIVGYTNAGKSTLLNHLTGAGIPANNRLFDTLDTTSRLLTVSDTLDVVISDTVGFIRKLPHQLVEAFKATLEELEYADLLLHVIDVSNPEWQQQAAVVENLIRELGAGELPRIDVFNKSDRLPAGAPNASQTAILEQAKASVPGASWADLYTPLWEHKGEDIFYRTDHHWTSLGAYYGYTGLATALGYTPVPLNDYTETVRSTEFYGTVFSSSGVRWVRPDTISTYVPDDGITVASHTYDNKGNPVEEPRQLYDTSFLSVKDKYSMFLGGNQPLGVVKNANNPDGPRLLIIRDSYADSLVPFLTPHFSEIHLLDLRYYKLSIADYIAQNGIDQALVLYSVPNFVTDSNLLWIAK